MGAPLCGRNCDVLNSRQRRVEGAELTESRTIVAPRRATNRVRVGVRLRIALPLLILGLVVALLIGLYVGYQPLDLAALTSDPIARAVFFRLRLPRVLMAGIVGASLAMVGAALQALFRNPLADPFTLGVSGGAALGASVAIAFGLGLNLVGVPFIFYRGVCRCVRVGTIGLSTSAIGRWDDAPGSIVAGRCSSKSQRLGWRPGDSVSRFVWAGFANSALADRQS